MNPGPAQHYEPERFRGTAFFNSVLAAEGGPGVLDDEAEVGGAQ
jgi:hypothetical protein